MRKCLLLFILTTCWQIGLAQFTDNFIAGDFTNNPIWEGNINNFEGEVESYKKVVVLHN